MWPNHSKNSLPSNQTAQPSGNSPCHSRQMPKSTPQPSACKNTRSLSSFHTSPSMSHSRSSDETQLANSVTSISRQLLDTFAFDQVDHLVGDLAHMRRYLMTRLPPSHSQIPVTSPVRATHNYRTFSPSLIADVDMSHPLLHRQPDRGPSHAPSPARPSSVSSSLPPQDLLTAYKGNLYARRCLATQATILEYLLGRCLQQCRSCMSELALTQAVAQQVERSNREIVEYAWEKGIFESVTQMGPQAQTRDTNRNGEGQQTREGVREGKSIPVDPEALEDESERLFQTIRKDFWELGEELRDLDGARMLAIQFILDPTSILRPPATS